MSFQRSNYIIAIGLAVMITAFSVTVPFFWDTIHTSRVLIELQQNGFNGFLLPSNLDAGHPPLFYAYLYGFVQTFGLNLWVVHLAMFPFVLLLMIAFQYLLYHFQVKSKWNILYLIVIPAVITQAILISYDFAMLALYMVGLYLILQNRTKALIVVTVLITLFSLRGIILVFALWLTQFILLDKCSFKKIFSNIKYYIPSVVVLMIWLLYHHYEMNYWLTGSEGWQTQRGLVSFSGLLNNCIAIARTQFDVGILILFLLNIYIFIRYKDYRKIQVIAVIPFIILSASFILFTNPIGHRYYLVVYVLELIPVLLWLQNQSIVLKLIIFIGLIVGNCQIYPNNISNAWDCSLMHLAYHQPNKVVHQFIANKQINTSDIKTVFPIFASAKQVFWQGDTTILENAHLQNIKQVPMILWSNIANDFSDEQIAIIQSWNCISESQNLMVQVKLYQNPNKK